MIMNTQIMMVTNQEMTIAAYAANRTNDSLYAALQIGKCMQLINDLKNGVVHGFFKKVDGTIREFIGTTNRSLASKKTSYPIGTMPKLRQGQIPFIDCETGEWRSMRIGSFIGYAE